MAKLNIICQLSETLIVALSKVRENIGHDDSLPYQAEILIADKTTQKPGDNVIRFHMIGTVYNDGWGGMSEVRADWKNGDRDKNLEYLEKIQKECAKHDAYYNGEAFMKYSSDYLFDIMAENFLGLSKANQKRQIGYWFDDDPNVLDPENNPEHTNCYIWE